MGRSHTAAMRPPLDGGGETLHHTILNNATLAQLVRDWDVRVSTKGGLSGRRGPAFGRPRTTR